MRPFRIVSVSVLSVALCLVMAWGTMVIVHAAPEEGAPATQQLAPAALPLGNPARQPRNAQQLLDFTSSPRGPTKARPGDDPLKEVIETDVAKAAAGQLQKLDRYLQSRTQHLAQQYAQTEETEARTKLKGELIQAIEKHFDVRHQIRKREVDELEARVRKLREHLQKRQGARQTIVEMRLNRFISAAEGLGWDTDLGSSRSSWPGLTDYVPPAPFSPRSQSRGLRAMPGSTPPGR